MSDAVITLQVLCGDLEEVLAKANGFGFGIISTEPTANVTRQVVWDFVARLIPPTSDRGGLILETGPILLDPFPDGTACIRWFGDANGISVFQAWAGRAGRILSDLGIIPDLTTTLEIPGDPTGKRLVIGDPLLAGGKPYKLLQQIALTLKRDYPEVVEQVTLASSQLGSAEQQRQFGIPVIDEKPVQFLFLRLPPLGSLAVEGFKRLCELRGGPRLAVKVKEKAVTIDGDRYVLAEEYILILESIISGGGNAISRSTMRKRHKALELNDHLNRKIDELEEVCPRIYKLIERLDKKGYSISKDYLE